MTEPAVVMTDGRPTPMVLSVARRLRNSLESGMPLTASELPRVVKLSSVTDAQQAYLTFWGTTIIVNADGGPDAERAWWRDVIGALAIG